MPRLLASRSVAEDAVDVGDAGVRDQRLAAVEPPAVAVALCGRGEAAHVAAGVGLGHREGGHRLAAGDARQPRRALRVGAAESDRHRAEALQREDGIGERRRGRERLADEAAGAQVGRFGAAAPGFGHRVADPTAGTEAGEDLAGLRSRRRVVSRRRKRRDLGGGKGGDLCCQIEVPRLEESADGSRVGGGHQLTLVAARPLTRTRTATFRRFT